MALLLSPSTGATWYNGNHVLRELESLREDKEDVKLELDIVTRQLERYEGTEFACGEPGYRLPIQESGHYGEEVVVTLRAEVHSLRSELEALKSKLAVCQKKECASLHARRQAALAEHRRKYALLHPSTVSNESSSVRNECSREEEQDSDYDIID